MVEDAAKKTGKVTADGPEKPRPSDRPLIVNSKDLFKGRNELWIEHGKEMYILRITSRGRLHLTKRRS